MKNLLLALTCVALLSACASTSETKSAGSGGDGYVKHKHIQKVWLAPEFNFNGYDTLLILPTKYTAVERANEVDMRKWAVTYLQIALAESLKTNGVFGNVVTHEADIKPGAKILRLENTIIEYEKGGGGARYFAGAFGGGQPVLKVRGEFSDGEKAHCKFEATRSGDSAGARMAGVWMSDREIQTQDINDLARDMSSFILQTAKGTAAGKTKVARTTASY